MVTIFCQEEKYAADLNQDRSANVYEVDPSITLYNPYLYYSNSATTKLKVSIINLQSKLFPALLIDDVIDGTITIIAAINLLPFHNIAQSVFVNLETVKDKDYVMKCNTAS